MKTTALLCFMLFAIAFARNPKDKYGILYVNEITANIDTSTVQIEDCFVEDNILRLDIIEEWTGEGVTSEGIFFNDGSVVLADDFVVNPPTTFPGQLFANGGIHADKPNEDFFSFTVEDNTGKLSVSGLLTVDGEIVVGGGSFIVAAGTGETTVREARSNPNGGLDVNGGKFVANPQGDVYIDDTFHTQGTIRIGSSATEDRYFTRVASPEQIGGKTVFASQNGVTSGGDLYIEPGVATSCTGNSCPDGDIFLGSTGNSAIRIDRPSVSGNAGSTFFVGQTSPNGDGGDIIIAPGDSTGNGDGGDLVIIPGLSGVATHGNIYLGTNTAGQSAFDLSIQRPVAGFGNGGDTFFTGQNAQNGHGGNLNILAGQGISGGVLNIIPGDANQASGNLEEQGDIILGNPESSDLIITRSESEAAGGNTYLLGQDSFDNSGGSLYIEAGSAGGNGNGGNIHLLPGSNPPTPGKSGVAAGNIYLGENVVDLTLTRPSRVGGGLDTYIYGQGGSASQGGDLFFTAGTGGTSGGDVIFSGGDHEITNPLAFPVGGGVIIEAGNGQIDGGTINMVAVNGGDITIATDANFAGDIRLNAGSGSILGDIAVGDDSVSFTLRDTPLIIDNSYLTMEVGSERLNIQANPTSIVEYNGRTILRSVSDFPVPEVSTVPIGDLTDNDLTLTAYRVAQLQNSLEILVNALGHCQHGLFEVQDSFGEPYACPSYA